MQRRTLAEGQGSICSIWRRGSWGDFCPEGKNEPFHVFETPWGVEFGKVRRTGSNVHQRFLLPMCRAQATVATVAAAPFASFSGRTEKGGPARPERMLNFLFLLKQFTTDSIKSIFLTFLLNHLCVFWWMDIPFSTAWKTPPNANALGGVFDQMLELCFFGNGQAVCIAVNHKHSVRHEIVGDHPAGN